MSSGAYIFEPGPFDILEMSMDNIHRLANEVERVEEKQRRLSEYCRSTLAEINAVKNAINAKVQVEKPLSNDGLTVSMHGVKAEGTDNTVVDFSMDDLFLADVDANTDKVTYIVLDYSEILAVSNARNSNEFRKLALASEINKQIMLFPADSTGKGHIVEFSAVMNKMLDDSTIDFDFFSDYILKRFSALKEACERAGVHTDSEEWLEYCSLCAMLGKMPELLTGDALKLKVDELKKRAIANKYITAAREALYETLEELGLSIIGEYELDEVAGFVVGESEDAGYKFFVSEDNSNFVFEMLEEKTAEPGEKIKMCSKRKKIQKRMQEKGFYIELVAENDDAVEEAIQISGKTERKDDRAELAKRRRALSGKKPKVKMMGG